jgi:hypothetical protein
MQQYGIQTDINLGMEFFQGYFDKLEWVESFEHYGKKITECTGGKLMEKFYVKNIPPEMQDTKLRRFVLSQFKKYGINTKNFRLDFFLVKEGGSMPPHADLHSEIAFLMPLTKNTGALGIKDDDGEVRILYNNMFILNTKKVHWVEPPTEDRLLFRLAIHDFPYTEMVIK